VKYDEHTDEFSLIDALTGDPKESLFLFEDIEADKYLSDLQPESYVRKDKYHAYKDLLSAVLDSSQLNNTNLYLFVLSIKLQKNITMMLIIGSVSAPPIPET